MFVYIFYHSYSLICLIYFNFYPYNNLSTYYKLNPNSVYQKLSYSLLLYLHNYFYTYFDLHFDLRFDIYLDIHFDNNLR